MSAAPAPVHAPGVDGLDARRVIVVGFHGSDRAQRALDRAVDWARSASAHLVIAHGHLRPADLHGEPAVFAHLRELALEQDDACRRAVAATAERAGLDHRYHSVARDPVAAILDTAARYRADALVVGASCGPRRRWGVAVRLVARAGQPVVVVP